MDHFYPTSELLIASFVMWGSSSWIRGSFFNFINACSVHLIKIKLQLGPTLKKYKYHQVKFPLISGVWQNQISNSGIYLWKYLSDSCISSHWSCSILDKPQTNKNTYPMFGCYSWLWVCHGHGFCFWKIPGSCNSKWL